MNRNASGDDNVIIESSGNPYTDAGLPDPEELLAKAKLAYEIDQAIRENHLTHAQAAELLQLAPASLANLLLGKFGDISKIKMLEYLRKLS